ncbi:MAG: bifunctional diaminohydroxyphosphoribosylaminopyrimidine deaminase/5-amino-6-(5-phosphoribosylamino)uracil reductase RibD [Myxococcota bacterium]
MDGERAMRLALTQARRASGRTHPNPAVGAVVVRGDRVLGRGYTRPPGGPHAEVVALDAAARRHGRRALRGARMAVTLEPCAHTGRTGPCVDALLEAGIGGVWIGCRDPHPLVAGRGLRRLRRAGVDVRLGVLEAECRDHHRGFLSVLERGRPWVTLKLASSLDGRIATASGESRWITGPAAREAVHRLRSRVDAVMVGSGTALADDPELTARRGTRVLHRPVRVLVDAGLRVGRGARLYSGPDPANTWVLHRRGARGAAAREATGARLLPVPARGRHLDLGRAMGLLADQGLTTLLVEGGGGLAAALLRANLLDEIHWFTAPLLLGADGRPAVGALALSRLRDAKRLDVVSARRIGDDWHWQARL